MKYLFTSSQRGIGQLGLIIAVVVVLAVAAGGWWVIKKNNSLSPAEKAQQDVIKNADCASDDKDVCKFLASWKTNQPYSMTVVTKQGGNETETVFTVESTNKVHAQLGGATPYETILIDSTLYTKAADGTWWKQTLPKNDIAKYATKVDFAEPTKNDDPKISYRKLGKEACGKDTCFKYEIVDSSATKDVIHFIWVDTKNYQIRRTQTITQDGTSDATFDYKKVTVTAPANAKELGPGQQLVPGQSQPTTLPNTGDVDMSAEEIQRLIDQYQN